LSAGTIVANRGSDLRPAGGQLLATLQASLSNASSRSSCMVHCQQHVAGVLKIRTQCTRASRRLATRQNGALPRISNIMHTARLESNTAPKRDHAQGNKLCLSSENYDMCTCCLLHMFRLGFGFNVMQRRCTSQPSTFISVMSCVRHSRAVRALVPMGDGMSSVHNCHHGHWNSALDITSEPSCHLPKSRMDYLVLIELNITIDAQTTSQRCPIDAHRC
jgi:hypothetical protein